jgi:hypothetical protein
MCPKVGLLVENKEGGKEGKNDRKWIRICALYAHTNNKIIKKNSKKKKKVNNNEIHQNL